MKLTLTNFPSYGIALLFALLVHAVVAGLVSVNWNDSTVNHLDIRPYYIEASIVAENPHTAAEERRRQLEKQRMAEELEKRRAMEARLRAEQEALKKARLEKPEPKPEPKPVVPEPQPEPIVTSPRQTKPDAGEVSSAFTEELLLALMREEDARRAVTDDEKAMAYVAQIQKDIIQTWSRPPSARNGMEVLLRVRLIPTGEVIDVKLEDSSGNDAFDRSAILAVRKAERFIVPSDSRRFERNFREFTVLFRPDDLRL